MLRKWYLELPHTAAHLILQQGSRAEVDLLLRTPRLNDAINATGFAVFVLLMAERDFGADLLEVNPT